MSWARILAPLSGGEADRFVLEAAQALARPFEAEVAAAYAPADPAELVPWMGEGFMGGVPVAAVDSLRDAARQGEARARRRVEEADCGRTRFTPLDSPITACLCLEARLSDVVVFSADAARGRGPLSPAFQQVLMEERRPVLAARRPPSTADIAVVAWDGGREASRAARSALPWLQKCARVVILTAPKATPRAFDPARLQEHFAARGVVAELQLLTGAGEPASLLLPAAEALGANLMVAGAFGHPRFQQFIFGGATRRLLEAEQGPSLFLSH